MRWVAKVMTKKVRVGGIPDEDDGLVHVTDLCTQCGNTVTFTFRKDSKTDQVDTQTCSKCGVPYTHVRRASKK